MRIVFVNIAAALGGAGTSFSTCWPRSARPILPSTCIWYWLPTAPFLLGCNRLASRSTSRRYPVLFERWEIRPSQFRPASRGHGPGAAVAGPAVYQYTRQLRSLLDDLAPDLVHSNAIKFHLLTGFTGPRSEPVVWHLHDYLGARPLMAKVLRTCVRPVAWGSRHLPVRSRGRPDRIARRPRPGDLQCRRHERFLSRTRRRQAPRCPGRLERRSFSLVPCGAHRDLRALEGAGHILAQPAAQILKDSGRPTGATFTSSAAQSTKHKARSGRSRARTTRPNSWYSVRRRIRSLSARHRPGLPRPGRRGSREQPARAVWPHDRGGNGLRQTGGRLLCRRCRELFTEGQDAIGFPPETANG